MRTILSENAMLVWACILTTTGVVHAQPLPGPKVNPSNGHTYFLTPTIMSWQEAQHYAVSVGGNLVTIRSAAEQTWLVQNFFNPIQGRPRPMFGGNSLWIGFTDREVEGHWRWVSGEPVDFTAWWTGEPSNSPVDPDGSGEDFAVLYDPIIVSAGGQWNDYSGERIRPVGVQQVYDIDFHGIVEVVPSPGAAGVLGISSLTAFHRRRQR